MGHKDWKHALHWIVPVLVQIEARVEVDGREPSEVKRPLQTVQTVEDRDVEVCSGVCSVAEHDEWRGLQLRERSSCACWREAVVQD
jgi:hypothetical protein